MKATTLSRKAPTKPSDDEIRDYAYHLYTQSSCIPGRDMDNWLEAEACLSASIPKEHAHSRLRVHLRPQGRVFTVASPEARNLAA